MVNGTRRPTSFRHRQSDIKQRARTPTPMKPTKMGGDEDGDEEVEVAADADAVVEDMVTVGLVSEIVSEMAYAMSEK